MNDGARDSDEIKIFQWKVLMRTPVPNEFYEIKLMVPGTGLEPAQLSPHAPQACVSTNFTTRAKNFSNIDNGALFGKDFLF